MFIISIAYLNYVLVPDYIKVGAENLNVSGYSFMLDLGGMLRLKTTPLFLLNQNKDSKNKSTNEQNYKNEFRIGCVFRNLGSKIRLRSLLASIRSSSHQLEGT